MKPKQNPDVHEPPLPAVYGGVAPVHEYGSDEELTRLVALQSLALSMHEIFTEILTTFGPRPDIEIAYWQEDMIVMARRLQMRMEAEQ